MWVNFRVVLIVGNVRVGNVKEPIGFEHLTSSRYLDFMAATPFNQDIFYGAFNNGFTPGVLFFDNWSEDDRETRSTGLFKNTTRMLLRTGLVKVNMPGPAVCHIFPGTKTKGST